MANLTPTVISRAGVATADVAASSGGDGFPNSGRDFAEFFNDSGSDIDVFLVIQEKVDGITPDPKIATVPAGVRVKIGPFPTDVYNDDNGMMQFTYSAYADLFINVFRLTVEN